ncbi:unnamed protein product [Cylindrotheca closterium]|uniref:Uncharacterized protein n=1 Tax=Cylindrotheca closterium TaxID=2856 RepID=A0AAD2FHA9_9STRA|nr:unnamed protein product [Cylindrotheca closterium]
MGYGFECLSALESQLVTGQCFCFVNNTDVIEAGNTVHHSGEAICASVQDAATLCAWENPSYWRRDQPQEVLLMVRPNLLHKYNLLPLIKFAIMKKLEYPMALTTLDAQQWTEILSTVLQVCLPKAGVCRNFRWAVVFAPLSYQGLGLPHPFGCQVFKHLKISLRHMANRTKTGDYMEANFQAHQLETGTSFGILQQVYNKTAILAFDMWMKSSVSWT